MVFVFINIILLHIVTPWLTLPEKTTEISRCISWHDDGRENRKLRTAFQSVFSPYLNMKYGVDNRRFSRKTGKTADWRKPRFSRDDFAPWIRRLCGHYSIGVPI